MLFRKSKYRRAIDAFAGSLTSDLSAEDICWKIADEALYSFGFVDGIVYLFNWERTFLLQTSALGAKRGNDRSINTIIRIKVGQGIVGSVAVSGLPELVKNTTLDERYKVDDDVRRSELAVPIVHEGKVIGVIDSEHPKVGFYSKRELEAVTEIAEIVAEPLATALTHR